MARDACGERAPRLDSHFSRDATGLAAFDDFTARRCRSGADGGVRPSTSGGAEAYGGEIEFACFGFGYGTAAQ